MNFERRMTATEIRSLQDGKFLEGYAASFNQLSGDLGGFKERLRPGTFDRAIREKHDVRFTMNHDPSKVMGRTKSGTLELASDTRGLHFRCEMPDTSAARDLHELVKRGDITSCSFAFTEPIDEWDPEYDEDEDRNIPVRTISSLRLHDVAAVTYPAYTEGTQVDARAIEHARHIVVPARLSDEQIMARARQRFDTAANAKARPVFEDAKKTGRRLVAEPEIKAQRDRLLPRCKNPAPKKEHSND